jgi:hypothetical protein
VDAGGGALTPTTKLCGRCGLDLPLDDYYVDSRARDGRASICRHCVTQDRREAAQTDDDGALQARLAARGVVTVAAAYRKGRQDGAAAAVGLLRRQGRLLPSDDEAAAQARAQRIGALADEALAQMIRRRRADA